MKKLFVLFLGIAIMAISACTEKVDIEAEKPKIQSILDQYVQAWKTEDIEIFAKIFAQDEDMVVVFADKAEPLIGWYSFKEAINEWFESVESEGFNVSFRDQLIKVNASGNVAWLSCIEDGNFIYQDQPVSIEGGRVTWGLEKRNGNWVIVQAHYSFPSGQWIEY